MENSRTKVSTVALILGALALLLAIVHFWSGPFSPTPTLEEVVAEKAVAIRDATVSRLLGKEPVAVPAETSWNIDRTLALTTSVLGALALVLSVFGFVRREPIRACGGAAVLGATAIAFQFAVVALGVIVLVILIAAVLNGLGFG